MNESYRVHDIVKTQETHRNEIGTIRKGQLVKILEVSGPNRNYCTIKALSSGLIVRGAILGYPKILRGKSKDAVS